MLIILNFRMKKIGCIVALVFLFLSCDDIIELEDISEDNITILAPVNNSVLTAGPITLSWEALQDAAQYKLQIATPTFDNASQILLDTTVTSTNYSKSLEPGGYQWRVLGENDEYNTMYTTQTFTVEE